MPQVTKGRGKGHLCTEARGSMDSRDSDAGMEVASYPAGKARQCTLVFLSLLDILISSEFCHLLG